MSQMYRNSLDRAVTTLKKKCSKYRVITFDVFDTLLKRDVGSPEDVFKIVEIMYEDRYGIEGSGFAEKRIEAEKKAHIAKPGKEITLDEIYQHISLVHNEKDILKKMEVAVEKELLYPNLPLQNVYNFCKEQGKIIYIISDMYLPMDAIESFLSVNGYDGYTKIYVSSEYDALKKDGSLFEVFLREEKIEICDVLHIGDSWRGDYLEPVKHGINAIHIGRYIESTQYIASLRKSGSFEERTLYHFINNHQAFLDDRHTRLGYEILGPILYAYCRWVHREAALDDAMIWFAARDMHLFKVAYEILYQEQDNKNYDYIYISRKSLRPLFSETAGGIEKSAPLLFNYEVPLEKLLKDMGYALPDIIKENRELNIDFEKKYSLPKLDEYADLLPILYTKTIQTKEKDRAESANKYLSERGFFGGRRIIFADVGWHGTTQFALQEIQKRTTGKSNIYGMYIGDLEYTVDRVSGNADFMAFRAEDDTFFTKGTKLFESLVAETVGTTLGYRSTEHGMVPELGKNEYVDPAIIRMQEGALQFVKDIEKSPISRLNINPKTVSKGFERLAGKPKKIDYVYFGNILYDDVPLAKPRKWRHYFLHFKDFKADLMYAPWRIGFLYRLFPIPLPYGKIYETIRRCKGKRI